MESSKLGLAQQTVEYVTHLVEEGDNIIVPHKSWFIWGRLRQVGNHCC